MTGPLNDVGFVLRLAQVAVFRDVIRVLEPFDLRPAQYTAIRLIGNRPGLEQHQLGQLLNVQKSNLVALIEELCRRDLVVRERKQRSYALSLAAAGDAIFADIEAAHQDHERRLLAALGGEQPRAALIDALRRITAAL